MRYRHTWCITQRVLWLDEKFDTRSEDEALLATCNISYLTRKLSASRKFDLATFFYFGELPEEHDKLEWSIVRKYNASRCLPPTLDTLVPRYLVVFVDILGSRKGTFQIPPSWSCLERAVLTTLSAAGSTRDCSYIIAHIRENKYNAVILVSTLVPVLSISAIDVTKTDASIKKEFIHQNFTNM